MTVTVSSSAGAGAAPFVGPVAALLLPGSAAEAPPGWVVELEAAEEEPVCAVASGVDEEESVCGVLAGGVGGGGGYFDVEGALGSGCCDEFCATSPHGSAAVKTRINQYFI